MIISDNSYFNFNELYKQKIAEIVKPQTNYDRIISKTPEELAEWLTLCLWGINREVPFLLDCNVDRCLDWLKQEAKV